MLIPQYSLRRLLVLTAASAVVALIVAQALKEKPWAIGITAGFAALIAALLVYAAVFGGVWLFSRFTTAGRRGEAQDGVGSAPMEQA